MSTTTIESDDGRIGTADGRSSQAPRNRGRTVDRFVSIGGMIAAAAGVLYLSGDPALQYTSVTAATVSIAALGFFVVHQVGGTTLGQAGAMAIGAYTSGIVAIQTGMPVFFAMLVGILASCVVGVLLGALVTRAKTPFHFILLTFTFSEVVRLAIERWVYGADGLPNIPSPSIGGLVFDTASSYFWLAMGMLAACMLFVRWLMSSNLARSFHAVRDGERHLAPSFGIGVSRYKVVALMIASGLAGLAGGLQAHFSSFVSPDQFNLHFSVLILTAAVFGGLGKVYGPVVGAFALTFLNESLVQYPGISLLSYGVVLVVAMLVMPSGLAGILTGVRRLLIRRLSADSRGES
ncbi:branched-chain amino acid ABC transporter permease [Pseudactinotalea sp.]|uniref:branched-chain amino acid ABC transporter permease n=1 Tax=Pseudactinotalea sp. TaxID=1926260 RepID=UPI003B3B0D71